MGLSPVGFIVYVVISLSFQSIEVPLMSRDIPISLNSELYNAQVCSVRP